METYPQDRREFVWSLLNTHHFGKRNKVPTAILIMENSISPLSPSRGNSLANSPSHRPQKATGEDFPLLTGASIRIFWHFVPPLLDIQVLFCFMYVDTVYKK